MMRKLKANEIECRVAQITEKGCSLLLYKTARVDRAILDEMYGDLWQNDFKVIDGKMYGGIGIYNKELNQWLWRWDCGIESNQDAEKGQASDCFKRAGFKWGIGIELYTAPFIFICGTSEKDEYNSKIKNKTVYRLKDKYIKYQVKEIDYSENGDINKLIIVDDKDTIVYTFGDKKKKPVYKKSVQCGATNQDAEIYIAVSKINNIDDLREYYEANKDSVVDKKAFYEWIQQRRANLIEIKEKFGSGN